MTASKIHLVIKAQEGLPFENWVDEWVGTRREKFLRKYYKRYAQSVDCYLVRISEDIYQIQPKEGA